MGVTDWQRCVGYLSARECIENASTYGNFFFRRARPRFRMARGKICLWNFPIVTSLRTLFSVAPFRPVREFKVGPLPFKPLFKPQSIPGDSRASLLALVNIEVNRRRFKVCHGKMQLRGWRLAWT